ncbi:MAG: hypothetical protein MN733_00880, partial [Nitrososphaera sp.]|nr:hypothetical protein [Nitrososphaera sp.]
MNLKILSAIALVLSGCNPPGARGVLIAITHEPTLATAVYKIVKGKTTKEEVLKRFGTPDIAADGANTKVSPNFPPVLMHSMIYELSGVPVLADPATLRKLYPYSSIDDGHTVFVYGEFCHKAGDAFFVPVVNVGAA